MVVTTWYAHDLDEPAGVADDVRGPGRLRYRHVLLVVPVARRGRARSGSSRCSVHAGGVVWFGPYLHSRVDLARVHDLPADDLHADPRRARQRGPTRLAVDGDQVSSYGYRYLLPVGSPTGRPPRRDTGSCATPSSPSTHDTTRRELVVGEYARGEQTRRLARFPLDPETRLLVDRGGRAVAAV